MKSEPEAAHRWLQKFVGEWAFEAEAAMRPDAPPEPVPGGTESVRPIGDLWVVGEGRGRMFDGSPSTSLLTLGFDPRTGRVTGSWIGSMMSHFWAYDGTLDAERNVLTLEADGPGFSDQNTTARYRDVIEFRSDDHRVLTASVRNDDGSWRTFMTAHYRRTT